MPTDVKFEADELWDDASPPAAVPDASKGRQAKRNDAVDKSSVSQKRTEQNRRAQVAFRERKRMYVKSLEVQLEAAMEKVSEAERIRQENSEMRAMLDALRSENARLQTLNARASSTSPLSSRHTSDEESTAPDSDDEVPQSPPVDVGKLRAELTSQPSLLSTVISHIDAEGRFNISNDLFFDASKQQSDDADPLLFDETEEAEAQPLFDGPQPMLSMLDVPITPAAFAASGGDYFGLASASAAAPGTDTPALASALGSTPAPAAVSSPEMVVPSDATRTPKYCPGCQCDPCLCEAMHAAEQETAGGPEPTVGQKRHLDETHMYVPASATDGNAPRFFVKNEAAQKDGHQQELCEMMSRATCKDKNPELRQPPKFIKKTTAGI